MKQYFYQLRSNGLPRVFYTENGGLRVKTDKAFKWRKHVTTGVVAYVTAKNAEQTVPASN